MCFLQHASLLFLIVEVIVHVHGKQCDSLEPSAQAQLLGTFWCGLPVGLKLRCREMHARNFSGCSRVLCCLATAVLFQENAGNVSESVSIEPRVVVQHILVECLLRCSLLRAVSDGGKSPKKAKAKKG